MSNFAIEMKNITKTFLNGKVVANENIHLNVKKNEVHALVGENGAGKSTLMSILFGVYEPDYGTIAINGEQVKFESAKDANKYGIGMVHQHFKLVDECSVLDNIILGEEGTGVLNVIQRKLIKEKLQLLIEKYKFNIDLDEKVRNLSVGQQQKTEILKLIYRNVDILIFDEPTAVLSKNEIDSFLEMISDFQKEGKTIIIITHKLSEIKSVANWVTVIRRGKYIDDFSIDAKSIDEIAELIVGNKVVAVANDTPVDPNAPDKLVVKNLNVYKFYKKQKTNNSKNPMIDFTIKAGEIFAIAGVEGNGQSELALMISGMLKDPGAEIIVNGQDINKLSIAKRFENGLSSIPEDRHEHGLILDWPIALNICAHDLEKYPYSSAGFLNFNSIYKKAAHIIKTYDVRGTTRGTSDARGLSGGNQQKLIIGREMARNYELLLLVQPTRGMDLGAISFIHKEILEAKKQGKAILLISYELDEILSLADKIAVMQNGRFLIVEESSKLDRQKIAEIMVKGV